ncbi:hypothetical protein [Xylella fastidiosa]
MVDLKYGRGVKVFAEGNDNCSYMRWQRCKNLQG